MARLFFSLLRWLVAIVAVIAVAASASAAPVNEKRVALVIGNSAYQHAAELRNPKNDAADMAAVLNSLGFKVLTGTNLDKTAMDRLIHDFAVALQGADVGLFFYAGHGLQFEGKNYLVPIDAKIESAAGIEFELVRLDLVQHNMERETKTNILFLDACRNNPLARNLARSLGTRSVDVRGLARAESDIAGTLISFATQPGNVARDGGDRNSPFTSALIKHLTAADMDLMGILIAVRNDVLAVTGGLQVPWENSALTGQFYFKPPSTKTGAVENCDRTLGSIVPGLDYSGIFAGSVVDADQSSSEVQLKLVRSGDAVQGSYLRAGTCGSVSGEVAGNRLLFSWSWAGSSGRGIATQVADRLTGSSGLKEQVEGGGTFIVFRQKAESALVPPSTKIDDANIVQQAKRSESEDLQIALQTNKVEALQSYLQKYPKSSKRSEVLSTISRLKRSEFDEWTLFAVGNRSFPQYIRISSIDPIGDRVAVRWRGSLDPSDPEQKQFPDATYSDDLTVFDCKQPKFARAERTLFSKSGQTLYHYKWADPQFLELSTAVTPGTTGYAARNILCNEQLRTPLVGKKELAAMNFSSLSSTAAGDGDMFYVPIRNDINAVDQKEVTLVIKMHEDRKVLLPPEVSIPDPPNHRTLVHRMLMKCGENKFSIRKVENYDTSNNLVYLVPEDFSKEGVWQPFVQESPLAVLQRIVCKPNETRK